MSVRTDSLRFIHLWVVTPGKPTGRATVAYREADGGLEFSLVFCQLDIEFTRANGREWATRYFQEKNVYWLPYMGTVSMDETVRNNFHIAQLDWRPASAIVDFLNQDDTYAGDMSEEVRPNRPSWAKRASFEFSATNFELQRYRPKHPKKPRLKKPYVPPVNQERKASRDLPPAPAGHGSTLIPASQDLPSTPVRMIVSSAGWPKTPSDF